MNSKYYPIKREAVINFINRKRVQQYRYFVNCFRYFHRYTHKTYLKNLYNRRKYLKHK